MVFSAKGAKLGGGIGAALNLSVGGPIGSAVGGLFPNLFGAGETSGYSRGDIERLTNQRHQQIQDFAGQLAAARQRYQTNLNNFQNLAFQRFAPIAEARFAGRGLQVTGGAFQSELAKQAAQAQAEGALQASQMEREDLGNVQNLYGGLASTQIEGAYKNPFQRQPNPFLTFAGTTGGNIANEASRLALLKAFGVPMTPESGKAINV